MPERKFTGLRLREAWILCFILGVVMLNYPFLHIFNKLTPVFGIPLLVLYLMVGWPASIFVIYLFSRTLDKEAREQAGEKDERTEQE
jgi:hypothetical protein